MCISVICFLFILRNHCRQKEAFVLIRALVYQAKSCTYYFSLFLLAYTESTIAVGLARVGAANQQIVCGSMKELLSHDLGPPLHSLIIPGHLHFIEKDMLRLFALNPNILDES